MSEITNHHKNNSSQIDSNNLDHTEEALDFLQNPNNFRPFSEGLIQLLEETTPSITFNNHKERTEYLYKKLKFIGSDIQKPTITAWFEGAHRPKLVSNSRKLMYEVCFALELPMEKVVWFFHHVYFDRSFNCHMIDEAVYYYCFLNNMTYPSAKSIIKKIMERPEKPSKNYIPMYTQKIREEISNKEIISSIEKLIDYLSNNKSMFQKWNLSAKDSIKELLEIILGKKESKQIIKKFQKKGLIPSDVIENCGLIIQELYNDKKNKLLEYISGKNILSIDFMLDMILETQFGIQKTAVIPDIVKSNFPSKKVFSDILSENKLNTSTSYDSIKKVLVLLKFYQFWCNVKLKKYPEFTPEELYNVFIDETNDLLFRCGYENLYEGNPYDWIFMRSSKASEPLDFLRDFVSNIKDTEEKDDF